MTDVTFDPVTAAVAFFAVGMSFLALIFSIVNRRRIREATLAEIGDPTTYQVVTDGKFYRVRGPFDTFYTMRFRDKIDAAKYAEQLAHYNGSVFNEANWRAAQ